MSPEEYAEKAAELDLDRGKLITGFKADLEEPPQSKPGADTAVVLAHGDDPGPPGIKEAETAADPKLLTVPGIQTSEPEPESRAKPKKLRKQTLQATPALPAPKPVTCKPVPPVVGPFGPGLSEEQILRVAYGLCDSQGEFTFDQVIRVIGELTVSGEIGLCLLNGIISGDILVRIHDEGLRFSNIDRPLDRSKLTPGTVLKYTTAGCIHCQKTHLERVTFVRWENSRTTIWLRVKDTKGNWHSSKYAADYLDFLSYCRGDTDPFPNEDYAI